MTDAAAVDPDLEFHTWPPRAGGGQHVGTPTGVLVVHRPTGLAAVSFEHRSQLRNRGAALLRLRDALAAVELSRSSGVSGAGNNREPGK